jgi:flagellar biosynthesis protein FlhA
LGESAAITKNPILLTEFVRQAIRRSIVKPYLNAAGDLPAYFLEPGVERGLESAVEHGEHSSHLSVSPQRVRDLLDKLRVGVGSAEAPTVLLAGTGCRYFVRQMVEAQLPNLMVLAHNEVPAGVRVISLGVIGN